MFSSVSTPTSSAAAGLHVQIWEKSLGLRISMQKILDAANTLPVDIGNDASDGRTLLKSSVEKLLSALLPLLRQQVGDSNAVTKDKIFAKGRSNPEQVWSHIFQLQSTFEPKWKAVLNKWHARLHFGSEDKKSKMKVFKQSLWDQIDFALEDTERNVEKSRIPWDESRRIDNDKGDEAEEIANLNSDTTAAAIEQESSIGRKRKYDEEVYDDRQFYSMLLKTFITQASGDAAGAASMRASDLEALRKYKKSKQNVDRKASKGRKIRYKVHTKLQNFMFPVPSAPSSIDVDRLLQSLFQ